MDLSKPLVTKTGIFEKPHELKSRNYGTLPGKKEHGHKGKSQDKQQDKGGQHKDGKKHGYQGRKTGGTFERVTIKDDFRKNKKPVPGQKSPFKKPFAPREDEKKKDEKAKDNKPAT